MLRGSPIAQPARIRVKFSRNALFVEVINFPERSDGRGPCHYFLADRSMMGSVRMRRDPPGKRLAASVLWIDSIRFHL
jgi:hypothetical protein